MEVTRYRFAGPGIGSWIAPAKTCAIIPTSTRKLRDLRLDSYPTVATFKNDGGAALAGTIEIQSSSTNINGLANLRKALPILPLAPALINDTCNNGRGNHHDQALQNKLDHSLHCVSEWPRQKEKKANGCVNAAAVKFEQHQ